MERSSKWQTVDDAALGFVQLFQTGINVLFLEIVQCHFDKSVSVLCFGGPEVVVKLFQFLIFCDGIGNEAEAFRAPAFDDRGEEEAVQESVQWVGVTKLEQGRDVGIL